MWRANLRWGVKSIPNPRLTPRIRFPSWHRPLALEAARQGITLLTNVNRTLPLGLAEKHVLVVGSLADDEQSTVGDYTNGGAKVVTVWAAVQAACAKVAGCTCEYSAGASPASFATH